MKRLLLLACLSLIAALLVPAVGVFSQTAAPGSGHGFLIDKHVAAHIGCGQCHTAGISSPPTVVTCLSCHGGTYQKLAASTANDTPNPHESHQGEIPCAECHHVHKASVTLCNQCHTFDMSTP
ncbi:cytochrome c3 family protein [Bradyrhizobium sp.]|uniref:cytochrome c3 family protein n=1 Tax=Bradyrhizobium sp. TaxID=376 RepID=UPI0039C8BCAD